LLGLRFEDLIVEPERTIQRLGEWLGQPLDPRVSALRFQRSRAHGATDWAENSAFQDVQGRFDRQPIGRWKAQPDSPIVRYAGWATRTEQLLLGYDATAIDLALSERLRFGCLSALAAGERGVYATVHGGTRWLRKRLVPPGSNWTD
jgi:hypothetical protein